MAKDLAWRPVQSSIACPESIEGFEVRRCSRPTDRKSALARFPFPLGTSTFREFSKRQNERQRALSNDPRLVSKNTRHKIIRRHGAALCADAGLCQGFLRPWVGWSRPRSRSWAEKARARVDVIVVRVRSHWELACFENSQNIKMTSSPNRLAALIFSSAVWESRRTEFVLYLVLVPVGEA